MIWHLIKRFFHYLPHAFNEGGDYLQLIENDSSDSDEQLNESHEEPIEFNDFAHFCVSDTIKNFPLPVGAMFSRAISNGDSKIKVQQMVNEIRKALKDNFKKRRWLDDTIRTIAEGKINSIIDLIGFPNYILDPIQLDDKFKDLDIQKNQCFDNILRINSFYNKNILKEFFQPVNRSDFNIDVIDANAYYVPLKNQLGLPVAIMQWPFFHPDNPSSLNYGALGALIGHEFIHSLSNFHYQYDKDANLLQVWSNKSMEKINKQADCFVRLNFFFKFKFYEIILAEQTIQQIFIFW